MTLALRIHLVLAGLLWSALILAAPPAANAGQTIGAPTYIGLNSGLVGWWTLDGEDTYTNNVTRNLAASTNNGTLTSGATRALGKIGQAVDLNGSTSFVNLGDINETDGASQMTISMWVYQETTDQFPSAISKFSGGSNSWVFGSGTDIGNGSDDIYFWLNNFTGIETNTNVHQLGRWEHWVAWFDGPQGVSTNRARIYVNGVRQTNTISGTLPATTQNNGNSVRIGSDSDGFSGTFWDGRIDEVRIYSRAISEDEIKRLYKIGSTEKFGTPNSSGSLASGLVGWWAFDGKDTAGSITYDRSGQANNGTLTAGTVRGLGTIGQAMEFDGVDDSIDFTTTNGLDNLGQMTVSLWVRPHTFGESDPGAAFISKKEQECAGSLDGGWTFGIDWSGGIDGSLCFQKGYQSQNLFVASVQDTVTLNEWQHVVVVWDGTAESDNVRFYRNNILAGIDFKQDGTGPLADDSTFDLGIGEQPGDSTLNFDGSMDDVRIYNRVLTPDEIKRLHKMGSTLKQGVASSIGSLSNGLVGHLTMDGPDTAINNSGRLTATDRSGNGNRGLSASAATTPARALGRMGQGLSFDGSNDALTTPDINAIDGVAQMSVSAWVYQNSTTSNKVVISEYVPVNDAGWALSSSEAGSGAGDDIQFRVDDGWAYTTAGVHQAGRWEHWVAVYNGALASTLRIKLYLNGVLQAVTVDFAPPAITSANSDSPTIGAHADLSAFWDGSVDDLRVYSRALSTDEIKRLYNMGR